MAGGGVYADRNTEDDGEDRGEQEELGRDPDAVGNLFVDRLADGGFSPIPVQQNVGEPGPPSLQYGCFGIEVMRVLAKAGLSASGVSGGRLPW